MVRNSSSENIPKAVSVIQIGSKLQSMRSPCMLKAAILYLNSNTRLELNIQFKYQKHLLFKPIQCSLEMFLQQNVSNIPKYLSI